MIYYLCKECCDYHGVYFSGIAANPVGRKSCHFCKNNTDNELEVIDETKLDQLKAFK